MGNCANRDENKTEETEPKHEQVHRTESDHENDEHEEEHKARPQEWRMWLNDTPEAREAFVQARKRMEDLAAELSKESKVNGKGFETEVPRVDQYFCADPKVGPKAATRDGKASMEVKNLKEVSDQGTESWEKATGVDISKYTGMPWCSLQKTRNRCKAKKIAAGTKFAGLKALEATEIKIVQEKIYADATGPNQALHSASYLTLAVEGTPVIIAEAVSALKMEELKPHALLNEGESGNYELNVSYPRFISIASAK